MNRPFEERTAKRFSAEILRAIRSAIKPQHVDAVERVLQRYMLSSIEGTNRVVDVVRLQENQRYADLVESRFARIAAELGIEYPDGSGVDSGDPMDVVVSKAAQVVQKVVDQRDEARRWAEAHIKLTCAFCGAEYPAEGASANRLEESERDGARALVSHLRNDLVLVGRAEAASMHTLIGRALTRTESWALKELRAAQAAAQEAGAQESSGG